ncbi:nucleotide sugar dehydrogenase [Halovenus sp. HT40]|uniref:nucleotide sugar dehydrogenase n=1 Tax=Halovenus sp. HT40 TaxID=3126691 RepID=UPI00300EB015
MTVSTNNSLHQQIDDRNTKVGVIGLGYVGLPLAIALTEAGFQVAGFDIDESRVARLQKGSSYVDDVSDAEIENAIQQGFNPGSTPRTIAGCRAYILAVPTGLEGDEPDMSAVESAAKIVAEYSGKEEILVVVSSTVYPGATREVVIPTVMGERETTTHFAMVPERINPGGEYSIEEIPLVVGANTDSAREAAQLLFDPIVLETYPVRSTTTAELAKTLENTYRMVNIALVNELITLSEGIDGQVWDAINAAATKPFGFQAFRPGPGVGGHCIPVDPQFLTWRAKQIGAEVSFIEDAHQINEQMPSFVLNRFELLLQARGINLADASLVALGAAYKPNVGDLRNSPALRVINQFPDTAEVTIVEPHTAEASTGHTWVQSEKEAGIKDADATILLVDHDDFDLNFIGNASDFIFDSRNVMPDEINADVVTLGEFNID